MSTTRRNISIRVEDPPEMRPLRFITVSGCPDTPYLGFRVCINRTSGLFLQMEMPQMQLIPGQDDMVAWLRAHARAIRIAAEPTEEKWLDPDYVEEAPGVFNTNTFPRNT